MIYSIIVLSIPISRKCYQLLDRGRQIASFIGEKAEMLNDIPNLWLENDWLDLFKS